MSLPVKLCEHLAQDCLQAVEGTKDPQTRELLLRHALEWMQDALAALKQSNPARGAKRPRSGEAPDSADEGIGAEFAPHGPGSALVASFSLPSTSSDAAIRTS